MDLKTFREYCLSKKASSEDLPFDETTIVFRVGNKIFALTDLEALPFSFNLKCDPEKALELREHYPCIKLGYHMNKKHWNTIESCGSLTDSLIFELIDHSYDLVFKNMKKSDITKISKS